MDVIVLSAVTRDDLAMKPTDATFAVTQVGGGPLTVQSSVAGASFVELLDGPRPLQLRVDVTPGSGAFFPITGHFEYRKKGELVAIADPSTNAPTEKAEFLPAMSVSVAQGNAVMLAAFLSRVQDATAQTEHLLEKVPQRRKQFESEDRTWKLPPLKTHVINTAVLSGGALLFDQDTIDPNSEVVVLRLKLKRSEAPQLLAVMWPKDLD